MSRIVRGGRYIPYGLVGVVTLFGFPPRASAAAPAPSPPIVVEHADTWRGTSVDEQFDLIGHVRITHGQTTLTCEQARYLRGRGEVILDGRVRMAHRDGTLTADHVMYFERDRRAVAHGAVTILDPKESTTITCGQAEYFSSPRRAVLTGAPQLVRAHDGEEVVITGRRLEYFFADADSAKRAVAQDSVTVIDRKERITVTCQRAEYTRKPERAILTGQPRLVKAVQGSDRDVIVTGTRMSYAFLEKRAEAQGQVVVTRGQLRGRCEAVTYDSREKRAGLTGSPVLWEGTSELRGQEAVLSLTEETVTRAVITGNASGSYAPDDSAAGSSRKSTIQGRVLTVSFDQDIVREIIASQNATSLYYPPRQGTEARGPNRVSANQITLFIDRGRLVRVAAEGSVVGTYQAPGQTTPRQGNGLSPRRGASVQ
ncbi:MAG: hypothetical protein HY710_12700 [Candidatus Latescibacteria bacterium]|nr:hypothetical protein [Candidatus Latescibacterota bacterium]